MTEMLLETVQFRSEFRQKIFGTQKPSSATLKRHLKSFLALEHILSWVKIVTWEIGLLITHFCSWVRWRPPLVTVISYLRKWPFLTIGEKIRKKNHKCVLVENDHLKDRWRAYALHFIHIICSAIICNLTPGSDSLIIWTNQIDRNIMVREHSLMRRRMIIWNSFEIAWKFISIYINELLVCGTNFINNKGKRIMSQSEMTIYLPIR